MSNSKKTEKTKISPLFTIHNYLNNVKPLQIEIEPFFKEIMTSEQIDSIFPLGRRSWALLHKAIKSNPSLFKDVKTLDITLTNIENIRGKKVLLFSSGIYTGMELKSIIKKFELLKPSKIITAAYAVFSKSPLKPDFSYCSLTKKQYRNFNLALISYLWFENLYFDPDHLALTFEIIPSDIKLKTVLNLVRKMGHVYGSSTPSTKIKSYTLIPRGLKLQDPTNLMVNIDFLKIRIFFLPNNKITVIPMVYPQVKMPDSRDFKVFIREETFVEVIPNGQSKEDVKMLIFLDWLEYKLNLQLLEWFFSFLKLELHKLDAFAKIIDYNWGRLEARYPKLRDLLSERLWGLFP